MIPQTNQLISGDGDGNIKVWNRQNSQVFASAGKDKSIKIWNVKDRTLLKLLPGHQDAVRAIAISPDGQYLVSGSWDKFSTVNC